MEMYYIGDNDNEFGLKYGDRVEVTPSEENITDCEYFGVHIYNREKNIDIETLMSISELIDSFTPYDFKVFDDDIPKKPYEENENMVCPNCMEAVTDDMGYCDNCMQKLDWN